MVSTKVSLIPPATWTEYVREYQHDRNDNILTIMDNTNLYLVTYFEMYEDTLGFIPVRTDSGGLCYPL